MTKIDSELRARLEAFLEEVTTMVKRAALESVSLALGGTPTPAKRGPGRPKGTSAPKTASRRVRGGKRTPEEVAQTGVMVADYVSANPGQGVEGIGKALGLSTKDLALPIIRLMDSRTIKSTGQRRGTKYFPGGGGSKGSGGKKKASKKG